MRSTTTSEKLRANGHDALDAIRAKAHQLAEAGLPKAADATEAAGKAIADFAQSASKSVAKSLRENKRARKAQKGLLQAAPLLRSAGRFAMRNPSIVAAAGVAIALVGYATWRQRQENGEAEG